MSIDTETYSEVVVAIKKELLAHMKELSIPILRMDIHIIAIAITENLREKDVFK